MAKCPKCGKKLRLIDMSQYCPSCGVNMRFYNFEENFYREAKLAELTNANIHVKIRRFKAAFIGSKLAIARLIVMVFPLLGFLIPACSFSVSMPYRTMGIHINALELYGILSGSDFGFINTMAGSAVAGAEFAAMRSMMFVYLVGAVFAVAVLLTSILCFISYKNMQKITAVCAGLGILSSIASIVFMFATKSKVGSVMVSFTDGFGLYACIVLCAAALAVNLLLWKKGIPVEYDEGMEERVAIYKQYKQGKVNLEDLPQPIVETEATREIDREIEKEAENIRAAEQAKEASV